MSDIEKKTHYLRARRDEQLIEAAYPAAMELGMFVQPMHEAERTPKLRRLRRSERQRRVTRLFTTPSSYALSSAFGASCPSSGAAARLPLSASLPTRRPRRRHAANYRARQNRRRNAADGRYGIPLREAQEASSSSSSPCSSPAAFVCLSLSLCFGAAVRQGRHCIVLRVQSWWRLRRRRRRRQRVRRAYN